MAGTTKSENDSLLNAAYNSYQNNAPVIHQLDDVIPQRHAYYGDASLQPNTGRTNSYDYALFGLALHELLDKLRLSIIISSIFLFLVTFLTWWQNLFRPFQLVLSLVVGAMVLVLLIVEVSSLYNTTGSESASLLTNNSLQHDKSNEAKVKKCVFATEKFGLLILYHPVGKTIYLVVCGAFCCIIGGFSILLGLLFLANAAVLLYCWLTYPEFRRTFDTTKNNIEEPDHRNPAPRSASWSIYSSSSGVRDHLIENSS